ncbi:MAG: SsrA-binding protein SmpB [Candidatus Omnitrophica bacterium]|nr:SsrA-binding protein SmpB [Candidatus Omnitrophota bacterium]
MTAKSAKSSERYKIAATNRKARFQYHILETMQAGIVLQGTEVKSIREGRVNLGESFASIRQGEMFLCDCHISPYSHGNYANHEPLRPRKLLMHKREIIRLFSKVQIKGLTLVPLKMYFVNGRVKVDIALVQGKKLYDKREDIKKRDIEREIRRSE